MEKRIEILQQDELSGNFLLGMISKSLNLADRLRELQPDAESVQAKRFAQ